MHAKVQRGRPVIKIRATLGSKDQLSGGRDRGQE
jgi:hypothetical protein